MYQCWVLLPRQKKNSLFYICNILSIFAQLHLAVFLVTLLMLVVFICTYMYLHPCVFSERYGICEKCRGHICLWLKTMHYCINALERWETNQLVTTYPVLRCYLCRQLSWCHHHFWNHSINIMTSLLGSVSQHNCQWWLKQRDYQWISTYLIWCVTYVPDWQDIVSIADTTGSASWCHYWHCHHGITAGMWLKQESCHLITTYSDFMCDLCKW